MHDRETLCQERAASYSNTRVSTFSTSLKRDCTLHIEGAFEPELIFAMAERNGIRLNYPNVEALREAYNFTDLQSFLDVYYAGMAALRVEQDFYELTSAYLERAKTQGVRHAEIFFDPQAHTDRGIAFATVVEGIAKALADGEKSLGITSRLIMCFLRNLSAESAMATFESALPYLEHLVAVGLENSADVGRWAVEVCGRLRSGACQRSAHRRARR